MISWNLEWVLNTWLEILIDKKGYKFNEDNRAKKRKKNVALSLSFSFSHRFSSFFLTWRNILSVMHSLHTAAHRILDNNKRIRRPVRTWLSNKYWHLVFEKWLYCRCKSHSWLPQFSRVFSPGEHIFIFSTMHPLVPDVFAFDDEPSVGR